MALTILVLPSKPAKVINASDTRGKMQVVQLVEHLPAKKAQVATIMEPARQAKKSQGWAFFCLLPLLFTVFHESSGDKKSENLFSRASCDFSIEFLKILSKQKEGNVIVSPTSVTTLLAMLQQGAKENTLKQLETALQMNAEQSKIGQSLALKSLLREKTNVTLEWGNRAYIRPGFEVAADFNSTIGESFGATIQELNFVEPSRDEAALAINNWVKEITHGNIENLISPSALSQDTVLMLVNAIYFKGLWDVPFMKILTKKDKFESNANNSVWAWFMSQKERFLAGEDPESGLKWVDLPFKDEQFSMLFLLPIEKHSLSQVWNKISGSLLQNIMDDGQTRIVTLTIPKFKLTEKVSLAKPLKELGVTEIFTQNANLGGVTTNYKTLSVSNILHDASIEIDETGGTATAATTLSLELGSFPKTSDHLFFKADHPFLFFILDRHNRVPLFAGIVTDPR